MARAMHLRAPEGGKSMRSRHTVTVAFLFVACGFQGAEVRAGALLDDEVEVPEKFQTTEQALGSSGRAVVFLELSGATLSNGASNARANTSFIVPAGPPVAIPPFDEAPFGLDRASAIAELAAEVRGDFAAFDVEVVTARPPSGAYTMAVVGGSPSALGLGARVAGIAPVDVGNPNRRDVAFVFSAELATLKQVANCISHELGHTLGLRHLTPPDDLMHPTLQPGPGRWQRGAVYGTSAVQDEPAILSGLFGAPDAGAAPPAGALNEWPYGLLEGADAGVVSGWAYDPDAPAKSLAVQLYANGKWVGTATADQPRSELAVKDVQGPAHGFVFALPPSTAGQTLRAFAVDDQGKWAIPLDGQLVLP
jgi:hypothetical protein